MAASLTAWLAKVGFGRRGKTQAAERPLLLFLSSVMNDELEWAREAVFDSLAGVPFLVPWVFEHTPASSEELDDSYLRHVRDADFFVWLVGTDVSPPVEAEVAEALASKARIIALRLAGVEHSPACRALLDRVKPHARYRDLTTNNAPELRYELNLALADEIVRAVRGLPGMGRLAAIDERGRESVGRIIERYLAAGVSAPVARMLAEDVTVGSPDPGTAPSAPRPLVIISADVGTGKSLHGERRHQIELGRYLKDASAPIPVWLPVRDVIHDLRGAIETSCAGLGAPRQQGAAVVLDGADEVGPAGAAAVLGAARVLVRTWPSTTIVVTTRPLPSFGERSEMVVLRELTEEEGLKLVNLVAGRDFNPGVAASWPRPIAAAVTRPLFAVLLGVALSQGEAPRSRAELVALIVEKAIGPETSGLEPLLRRLAVESLRRAGGPVPIAEVVAPGEVDKLISTRLVVLRERAVLFPLIIFAQWFAAAALADADPTVETLLTAPVDLDEWLYPLALCAALYPHDTVTRVLSPLARRQAGFASRVVEEALSRWARTEVSAPPSLDAARRVRQATDAWVQGLGDLSQLVAPLREDGSLASLGAAVIGSQLALYWYLGREQHDDVFDLPQPFNPFDPPGPGWTSGRLGSPSDQAGWAWQWSFGGLSQHLARVLHDRLLPTRGTALFRPVLYQLVAQLHNHGALTTDDFDVAATQRLVAPGANYLRRGIAGFLPVAGLHDELESMLERGERTLRSPFPVQDREMEGGGWIWSPYSPERLLERTTAVFSTALDAYETYMETWFAGLRSRMVTAANLPAVVRGWLQPPSLAAPDRHPLVTWYFDPLPAGEPSRVELELDEGNVWARRPDSDISGRLAAVRPAAAKWAYPISVSTHLEVFNTYDAAELVYSWLWTDLKNMSWVQGNLRGRGFSYESLALV